MDGVAQVSRLYCTLATELISSVRVGELEDFSTVRQRAALLDAVRGLSNHSLSCVEDEHESRGELLGFSFRAHSSRALPQREPFDASDMAHKPAPC